MSLEEVKKIKINAQKVSEKKEKEKKGERSKIIRTVNAFHAKGTELLAVCSSVEMQLC